MIEMITFAGMRKIGDSDDAKNSIFFSITGNCREDNTREPNGKYRYNGIRFSLHESFLKALGADEKSRMQLGCSPSNNKIWFLKISKYGCKMQPAVTKAKRHGIYFTYPFKHTNDQCRYLNKIGPENIKIHLHEKVIEMNVESILTEPLVLDHPTNSRPHYKDKY